MPLIGQIKACIKNCALDISRVKETILFQSAAKIAAIPIWGKPPNAPSPAIYFHQALIVIETYDHSEDVLDWCKEYGWSPAEPDKLERFKAIGDGRADLANLIGSAQLDTLILGLSLHQAIETARPAPQEHHSDNE
ncbi:MAG: hypothetical protein AAF296_11690 [Pseudomonadota bacterium]